jgi:hypothetical protein
MLYNTILTSCSKHVEAINKLIVKQVLCIKLVNYSDKYTEMHGQQNIKISDFKFCQESFDFDVEVRTQNKN